MDILYFFEGIRNSFLDFIMLGFTKFGEELLFILIAIIMLWCVDKKKGYYLLMVGFLGIQINQLLKITFKIPRPWVKDPNFTIVEAARKEATGFSFPSGHTQVAVGTYGTIFATFKNKWVKVLMAVLCIAVPVSRMYLGVHTPLDVGVSFLVAAALVILVGIIMKKVADSKKGMRILFSVLTVISIICTICVSVMLKGATDEQLVDGLENFYKMLGGVLGMFVAYELDVRYINFKTKAVWWAQIIKVISGLVLIIAVKLLGYKVFGAFMPAAVAKGLTYFILVLFAAAVWPITFKKFSKQQ